MSEREPNSDRLAEYVAAFADSERPSDASREAAWANIERQTAARPVRWVAIALVAVAAAVLLFFVVDWGSVMVEADESEPSQAPYQEEKATATGVAQPVEKRHAKAVVPGPKPPDVVSAEDAEPDPEPSEAVAHTKPRRAPRDNAPPKTKPGPSQLAEETALLKVIQEAIVQGRPNAALGKIAAYRERFGQGVFGNEVTVAKAQALCGVGRPKQARKVVDAFVKRHPRSHLVGRAKTICLP